jgi:septum formation protein
MKIILGSQSPRRKEIMEFFSLPFQQVPAHFDEDSLPFLGDPAVHAITLSQKKAEVLAQKFPNEIIVTADTVVFFNGKLYNKPVDKQEAFLFLKAFAGNWQEVITAVTVRRGEKICSSHEKTRLLFNSLSDEQVHKFHTHCYALDKAGGFAIEKAGELLISKMEGCYYNVLGLPINTLALLLLNVGINLWDFLKEF